ncbi:hypothetical protein [Lentzea sp. CA-135723]|uniref:hypothetical protein n=1 Tax=Lentzea sp. CA-135723 TaxID=3239950 RepID=UPI003D91A30D
MVSGGWRLAAGVAVLMSSALVAPVAAQADTGCEWIRTDVTFPAGVRPGGLLIGEGDWMTSTNWSATAVVWHQEVPATVVFPEVRGVYDITGDGVLLSSGESGLWRGGEKLEPLPGGPRPAARAMNAGGDVVGRSGDALVVWPAGSTSPRVLEGTDDGRKWWATGIDDAGNVIGQVDGEQDSGYVWGPQGGRTELQPLEGHDEASPSLVHDGRVYGTSVLSGSQVAVEWDLNGEIVRTLPGGGAAVAANDAGDLLMRGESLVLRGNGRVDPLPSDVFPDVLTESGDVFGGRYFDGPVKLRCS